MVRLRSRKDESFRLWSKSELLGVCFKRGVDGKPWSKEAMRKALSKDQKKRLAVRAARREMARLEKEIELQRQHAAAAAAAAEAARQRLADAKACLLNQRPGSSDSACSESSTSATSSETRMSRGSAKRKMPMKKMMMKKRRKRAGESSTTSDGSDGKQRVKEEAVAADDVIVIDSESDGDDVVDEDQKMMDAAAAIVEEQAREAAAAAAAAEVEMQAAPAAAVKEEMDAAAAAEEMEAAAAAAAGKETEAAAAGEYMQYDAPVDQFADPVLLPEEDAVIKEEEGEFKHEDDDDDEGVEQEEESEGEIDDDQEEEEEEDGERRGETQKEKLPCDRDVRCPYRTTSERRLNRHNIHHDVVFPHACTLCSYSTEQPDQLIQHTRQHGVDVALAMPRAQMRRRQKRTERIKKLQATAAATGDPAAAAAAAAKLDKEAERRQIKKRREANCKEYAKRVRNELEEFERAIAVDPSPEQIEEYMEMATRNLLQINVSVRMHALCAFTRLTRLHGERPQFLCFFNRMLICAVGLLKDVHKIKESCCELLLLAAQTVYKYTRTARVIEEYVQVTEIPVHHHNVNNYAQLAVEIVDALANGAETMQWLQAQHYVEQAVELMRYPMPQAVHVAAALLLQALISKLDSGQRANIDRARLRAALQQLDRVDAALARKIDALG